MQDYAKMYKRLFRSQAQAIEILQQAQQDAEEMYISAPDTEIRILKLGVPDEDKSDGEK